MISRKLVDCCANFAVDSGGLDVPEPVRSLPQQRPQSRAWQFVYLRGSFLELISKFSSRHAAQTPHNRGKPNGIEDGTRDPLTNPNLPTE